MEVPFEHISMDLVEPSVAQALFQVISLLGILKEISTDQCTMFMSHKVKELYELLDIKSVWTSIYQPLTCP